MVDTDTGSCQSFSWFRFTRRPGGNLHDHRMCDISQLYCIAFRKMLVRISYFIFICIWISSKVIFYRTKIFEFIRNRNQLWNHPSGKIYLVFNSWIVMLSFFFWTNRTYTCGYTVLIVEQQHFFLSWLQYIYLFLRLSWDISTSYGYCLFFLFSANSYMIFICSIGSKRLSEICKR